MCSPPPPLVPGVLSVLLDQIKLFVQVDPSPPSLSRQVLTGRVADLEAAEAKAAATPRVEVGVLTKDDYNEQPAWRTSARLPPLVYTKH